MKTAVILTNYNMPEATDLMVRRLTSHCDHDRFDMIVVDNGSDITKPSKFTTVQLPANCQTTGGYPRILQLTEQGINRLAQKKMNDTIRFDSTIFFG